MSRFTSDRATGHPAPTGEATTRSAAARLSRPGPATGFGQRLRLRWAAARHRGRAPLTPRRILGLALSLLLAVITGHTVAEARRVTAELGPVRSVAVAATDLPAGRQLGPHDLEVRPWPVGNVPQQAPNDPDALLGRTTRQAIGAGEAVTATALGTGRFGLRSDESAVTVATNLAAPPAIVGDRVALYAVAAVEGPVGVDVEARLLGSGRLLAQNEGSLTIAADTSLVPAVLRAQAQGTVEVVLVP